ncbi:MAG: hypothetical protein Q9227_001998 [Pyrenula ochraceoflavens]
MPGRVNFAGRDSIRRPVREDELFVMDQFAHHAKRCPECAYPYQVALEGRTLCDRGHLYAKNVAEYLYLKAGVTFSELDRTSDRVPVQVEIPKGYGVIRDLLNALNLGLRKRKPVVSHDKHYPVPDRRPVPTERRKDYDVIEVEPRRHHEIRREKSQKKRTIYVPGRGSLYEEDQRERKQRREEEPVIIYATPTRSKYKEHHR